MGSLLINRQVILLKLESTYDTDANPSASADSLMVENLAYSNEGLRMVERPAIRTTQDQLAQVYGGTNGTITFDVELKGAGATYSASVKPEIDAVLQACGISSTLDTTGGSESVTYKPVSAAAAAHKSATVYFYQDGLLRKMTGARGNASFNIKNGEIGKVSISLFGHVTTLSDASLPTPSYDSVVPPVCINGSVVIGGTSVTVSGISWDLNNEIVQTEDLSGSEGYGPIIIKSRDVAGSFDPERELVATEPFDADLRSGKQMSLASGTIGGTQYNRYSVTLPKVSYRDIGEGDRDGILTYDISFGAEINSGDDEFSLVFN